MKRKKKEKKKKKMKTDLNVSGNRDHGHPTSIFGKYVFGIRFEN